MSLSADALKYVVDMSESRMPRASAWPAAKGSVCKGQSKLCSIPKMYYVKMQVYLVKFNVFHVKLVIVEEPDIGCLKHRESLCRG